MLEQKQPTQLHDTHYISNRIHTDQAIFDEEREKIFGQVWKFVCHESEVPNAGDYRAVTVAGYPFVIVRDRENKLNALNNSCTHRGQKIVRKEAGDSRSLQCFYHLWNFSLEGNLRATTRPEGYAGTGFENKDFCLAKVRVDTVCGLVFVTLNPASPPLEEWLGPAVNHFRETLGSRPMEVFLYHRAIFKTNWKLWNDNNSELYHEWMHYLNRNTNLQGDSFFNRKWRIYPNGHNAVEEAEVTYEAGGLGNRDDNRLPGTRPNGFYVANIFPDTVVNCRSTVVRMDTMIPLAPGLTMIEWRGIGIKDEPDDVRAMRARHFTEIWGPFGRNITEDQIAVETQWEALSSGMQQYSILSREEDGKPMDDCNLRAYYQEWSRLMGRKASDPFQSCAN